MQTGQWKTKEGAGFFGNYSMKKLLPGALQAVFAMLLVSAAWAEEDGFIENVQCNSCHKSSKQTYLDSAHGRAFTADATTGCQTCHGGGAAHKEVAGDENYKGPQKIEAFKVAAGTPGEKNRACLTCHENKLHANWRGSKHDMGGVSCTECHTLHKAKDTVRQDVCYTCHQAKRASSLHNPVMPRNEGAKDCAKCHDSHGGTGPSLLKTATVNDNCYSCHAEKRGPYLWEHAPVRENCATCHNPHGTPNANLLTQRTPYLCQTCHSGSHSNGPLSATGLPPNAPGITLAGKSCLNCHPQIHGSNHPSGARFQR